MATPIGIYRRQVNKLIAKNQLDLALKKLIRFFEFFEMEKETSELVAISCRLELTETDNSKGKITRENYIHERNAILDSLNKFLDTNFSDEKDE
ncbi:MAG: hypothetical protein IT258_02315 [Saprospiraceae bacterium]|nr:hypothetical protein [Saprospiraceae bacterium]